MEVEDFKASEHVMIGSNDPRPRCPECDKVILYKHEPVRCGCTAPVVNMPCEHVESK